MNGRFRFLWAVCCLTAMSCGDPTANRIAVDQASTSSTTPEDSDPARGAEQSYTTADGQIYLVMSHSITDRATGVEGQATLSLTFNHPIEETEIADKMITLLQADTSASISLSYSLREDKKTVEIQPVTPLEPSQIYTLRVAGASASDPGKTLVLSFLTEISGETRTMDAGGQHLCQIMQDQQTRCLSVNRVHPDNAKAAIYQPVAGLSPAVSVATGSQHACIITTSHQVESFDPESGTVTKEESLKNIVSLAVSRTGLCALDTAGGVYCKENGETVYSQPAGFEAGALMLAAGGSHYCAVDAFENQIRCWGANQSGQIRPDQKEPLVTRPTAPVGLLQAGEKARSLALGLNHSCLLADSGKVRCWGENALGQLGGNNFRKTSSIHEVVLKEKTSTLVSGSSHLCAVSASSQLACWGWNAFGQTGVAGAENSPEPVIQKLPEGIPGVSGVIAGQYFNLIRSTDNTMHALGTFISDFEKRQVSRLGDMQSADYLVTEPQ